MLDSTLYIQPGTSDHEKQVEKVEEIIQNGDGDIIKPAVMITRIYYKDQVIPKRVHSKTVWSLKRSWS